MSVLFLAPMFVFATSSLARTRTLQLSLYTCFSCCLPLCVVYQVNKTMTNVARTLLVSPDHNMVHTIVTASLDSLQDPSTVPSNVTIESTIGISPGQVKD
jgi:hypothetical protein